MRAYLDFIAGVAHRETRTCHEGDRLSTNLKTFFGSDGFQDEDSEDLVFRLTWDGLRGRFLSTSVAPPVGDPRRSEVVSQLFDVFEKFEQDDTVSFQLRWRHMWSELKRGV